MSDRTRRSDGTLDPVGRLRRTIATQPALRRASKDAVSRAATRGVPAGVFLAGLRATRTARTRLRRADVFDYSSPPDPFAIRWIDPTAVRRFSPRVHPPWWNRRRSFGDVRDGDWDGRPYAEAPRPDAYPKRGERALLYADRVVDSPLYVAIRRRLRGGVDWTDTAFVRGVVDRIESGTPVWQDCRTRADVLERCSRLDDLAETIREEGIKTQWELIAEGTVARAGILHALGNEIVVDVARDGEPLLVSGKHRFSIARALGLEAVPVAVCVRHEGWMRTVATDNNG
ncbi:hypothetical protein [Natronococcus roseus]|uniref:hypothetical protein n=1 Tax=Natronococcus roseus TaxID=1052014 RepID=UPI00374CEE97